MNSLNIPVRPSSGKKYIMTDADKEYLNSFAIDGIIPFNKYITAMNKILNSADDLTTPIGKGEHIFA